MYPFQKGLCPPWVEIAPYSNMVGVGVDMLESSWIVALRVETEYTIG